MTLNMAQMMMGDGIKKDTMAIGVFVITLHHAEGLSDQDSNGKSDPYIVLSYAKFGKPLYSTRIIMEDLSRLSPTCMSSFPY
jgi:Ca2+-dependent lipid-binding protein